jgi:hypothetical protein
MRVIRMQKKKYIQLAVPSASLTTNSLIITTLTIQNYQQKLEFQCVESLNKYDIIIGMNWFMTMRPNIKWNYPQRLEFRHRERIYIISEDRLNQDSSHHTNNPKRNLDTNIKEISSLQLK